MNVRMLVISGMSCLAIACAPPATEPVTTNTSTTTTTQAADVVNVIPQRRDDVAPGFTVEVACSETDLRKPIAILRWNNAGGGLTAEEQRIDVTVFKDGFERGEFASIDPLGGRARMAPSADFRESAGNMIRPLDLVVAPRPSNEATPDAAGTMIVEVQNLEPGVLYQWRMVGQLEAGFGASETITVEAPVCVADEAGRRP